MGSRATKLDQKGAFSPLKVHANAGSSQTLQHTYPVANVFNREQYEYPTQRVNAYATVMQWFRSVTSTKTPASLHVSQFMLRAYALPSMQDMRFEYIPTNPHTHGDFGGVIVLKQHGKVKNVLLNFSSDAEAKQNAPALANAIVAAMKMPGMQSVGFITSSPLNQSVDSQVHKVFRLGPYGDLIL